MERMRPDLDPRVRRCIEGVGGSTDGYTARDALCHLENEGLSPEEACGLVESGLTASEPKKLLKRISNPKVGSDSEPIPEIDVSSLCAYPCLGFPSRKKR